MYNGKPALAAALTGDTQLGAIVPADRMFNDAADFDGPLDFPYLTYDELNNSEALHADDEEAESEVTFRIHLWNTASNSAAAAHVERIMKALGYGRNYAQDLTDVLDNGTKVKHKVMSYTGIFTA